MGHHRLVPGAGTSDRERYRNASIDYFWPRIPYGTLDASSFDGVSLAPLAGYADKILLPRGLHTAPGGYRIAGHRHGNAKRITAAPLAFNEFGDESDENDHRMYADGISLDQEIARQLNPPGRGALTLRVGQIREMSSSGVISYRGPNDPVTGEPNPWRAYQGLVGMTGASDEAMGLLVERRQSVIDLVREDLDHLQRMDLSRDDRDKLEAHLTATRELELRMDDAGLIPRELPPSRVAEIQAVDPDSVEQNEMFPTIGEMQMDVIALAIASGYTHAASLQWSWSAGQVLYRWDGMNYENPHHPLSHGNTSNGSTGDPIANWQDKLDRVDAWYAKQLRYLLDRLQSYTEGDGTVLDNCAVLWSNEFGINHSCWDVPHVLVGSCGGYFRTGRYVKVTSLSDEDLNWARWNTPLHARSAPHDAPHNKLLTTILNAVGVRASDGAPVRMFGRNNTSDDDREHVQPGELDELKAS
jgi:hypothetical protein